MEGTHSSSQESNPVLVMFDGFRAQLDEHHERRERIVRASRDVTALSKKIIFTLQRTPSTGSAIPPNLVKVVSPFYEQINNLFTSVAPDLRSINNYRYQRQVSPGIQEFIEAIAFQYYLETETLITYEQAQERFPADVHLTEDDYLLGLFDMTGELMRFAITQIATGRTQMVGETPAGQTPGSMGILTDLRSFRVGLERLDLQGTGLSRDATQKLQVMRQSVEKVETAVYGFVVRGSERPKGWLPDLSTEGGREAVEGF